MEVWGYSIASHVRLLEGRFIPRLQRPQKRRCPVACLYHQPLWKCHGETGPRAVEKGAKGRGWVIITASQIESRPQNDRFTPNGGVVRTDPLFISGKSR